MHAAQGLEVLVVEALHPHRQARDARRAEGAKTVFLERTGVGLHRDLAIGLQPQAGANVADQPVDGCGREQAGRAATDEDAVHGPPPDQGQHGLQVGHQSIDVALLGHLAPGARTRAEFMRVEVAVRALF